jgi:hypothetical protein
VRSKTKERERNSEDNMITELSATSVTHAHIKRVLHRRLGNNNGLVMLQVQPAYKPSGYDGSTTTILRNIRIEGSIPGLVNLKPYTKGGAGEILAEAVPVDKVGNVGEFFNIETNTTRDIKFTGDSEGNGASKEPDTKRDRTQPQ